MGTPRFLVVYFCAGIFGCTSQLSSACEAVGDGLRSTVILGGNFSLVGQPSVGASGAIFGTHASAFVDLIAHWSIEYRPKRKLIFLLIELVLGVALGFVPGIDNFAHLGGFAMGLLLSIVSALLQNWRKAEMGTDTLPGDTSDEKTSLRVLWS